MAPEIGADSGRTGADVPGPASLAFDRTPIPTPRPEATALGWTTGPVSNARELAACAIKVGGMLEDQGAAGLEVLSVLPHLVYWKDLDGRYLGANEAFRLARNLTDPGEYLGRTEAELPVQDAFAHSLPSIEQNVIATGVPATGVQSISREQPDSAKVLLTVLPLRTSAGVIRGLLGVGADVTGLSDLDQKLSHASRLESIGRLAENIAHQINTPVQYITDNVRFIADGLSEALRVLETVNLLATDSSQAPQAALIEMRKVLAGLDIEYLDDELPAAILQTLEGLSQIDQIVGALNAFSRPEGAMVPTYLNHIVDNAVQLAAPEWMPVADLHLHLDPQIGQMAAFEGELRQVILNLVLNSAQAVATRRAGEMAYEQGLIEVSTHHDHDRAVIIVRDDGCGMDEATRARIFDPFFTTKEFGQSTGQGLCLAYATIVGRHHGSIDVESTPGGGATFTVTLPLGGFDTAPSA